MFTDWMRLQDILFQEEVKTSRDIYRITQWLKLEETSRDHLIQLPY